MARHRGGVVGWLRALLAPAADPRADDPTATAEEVAAGVRRAADRIAVTRASLDVHATRLRAESAALEALAAHSVAAGREDQARRELRRAAGLLREADELAAESDVLADEEAALRTLDHGIGDASATPDVLRGALEARRLAAEARVRARLAVWETRVTPTLDVERLREAADEAVQRAAVIEDLIPTPVSPDELFPGQHDAHAAEDWVERRLARLREAGQPPA